MKKILISIALVLGFVGLFLTPAHAQAQPGQIISVNSPISAELRAALTAWLENSPPSSAVYYAVTYTQPIGFDTYVSMVGLNIANPDDFWSIVGDDLGNQQVIWMDTVRVLEDGTITFPFAVQQTGMFKLAMPIKLPEPGAGGGSYVRFPWQPAKAVQYGILGVHDAEFGLDANTYGAVDLISGTDMGSGAANDSAYASVSGTVTYICDYEDTVAVRLVGGGDTFLYAHLLPNANLVIDHTFQAGQMLGTLAHGTFTDECGNAAQKDNHWHLHWGFAMNNNSFQAEGCILQGTSVVGVWNCGNTKVKILGYLYHYGNIGVNPDTGTVGIHLGGAGGGPSFWDYLLPGVKGILDALVFNNLPEHSSGSSFITPIMNAVTIVFRITNVLIRGNLNLVPSLVIVMLAITLRLTLTAVTFAGYIYRILRG